MSTEHKKEYDKLRYQRLKSYKNAQSKRWAKDNHEKSLAIGRKSKNKARFSGLRILVLERDNYQCVICQNEKSQSIVVHHKDETENRKRMNANNIMDNLITLCRSCHRSVHNNKLKI